MSEEKYIRFGKYLILDHLVDGGMAKICRANYLGEQANKIVAIKMVQARYSTNPSFVQMFEDELKVTFALVHPNIAQVYDYGLVNKQLYSAMEYVDGANLKQYLDRLKEKKFVFPVEISTFIISQVSLALQYAHKFQDKLTGKPSNIIHRDISPHNIMLTYDGAVKVIDFGIAKADSNTEATQAGTIKGKLSYLAPEYLEGLELDHRYDQFAVGITLWEMLCSRKLFTAKNDLAVLKQIQQCTVPRPSSINPNVPKELDEIVLKALSKDRNQRYENMDKLNRALVRFLYANYPEFNATDLSYFAKQLFKTEIERDKKKFVEFGKIDLKPYLRDIESQQQGNNSEQVPHLPGELPDNAEASSTVVGSFLSADQKTGKIELDLGSFDKKDSSIPNLDLDFSEITAVGIKTKILSDEGSSKTTTANTSKKVSQSKVSRTKAKFTSSSRSKKAPEVQNKKKSLGVLPVFVAAGVILFFVFKDSALQRKLLPLEKESHHVGEEKLGVGRGVSGELKTQQQGRLALDNLESSMEVYLNGELYDIEGISTRIYLNTSYTLVVSKAGFKKWKYEHPIYLAEGELEIRVQVPELRKESSGFLTTSQNFSPGSVIRFDINGESFEKNLPLESERVPAGSYDAVISNKLLGTERKVRFTVIENKRNFLK